MLSLIIYKYRNIFELKQALALLIPRGGAKSDNLNMDTRKELILSTIIKEHIKTGAPVGSSGLVEKYKLNVSPATVRNEMAVLEDEGFIVQPHTSAGRIPTEKAYRFFIKNLKEKKPSDAEEKLIISSLEYRDEQSFKNTAKTLAKISDNAVFWAFHRRNLYYTGISNLLQQPEFAPSNTNLIYDISAIIDRIDEIIEEIFDDIEEDVQVLVGSENPFGNFCSAIVAKYKKGGNIGMFGIISPMRMNYEKNLAIMKFIRDQISNKQIVK